MNQVRNVPALGCGDDLLKLFSSYGDIEELKPMDAEDCEPYTDVYWIKFRLVSNARFAKRKLDEYVFLGNRLQVLYTPEFESLSDTQDKLETRRREVLARLNPGKTSGVKIDSRGASNDRPNLPLPVMQTDHVSQQMNSQQPYWGTGELYQHSLVKDPPISRVSTDQDYFPSQSMNQTVKLVREKLDKIQSSTEHLQAASASKKPRVDNRRRI